MLHSRRIFFHFEPSDTRAYGSHGEDRRMKEDSGLDDQGGDAENDDEEDSSNRNESNEIHNHIDHHSDDENSKRGHNHVQERLRRSTRTKCSPDRFAEVDYDSMARLQHSSGDKTGTDEEF